MKIRKVFILEWDEELSEGWMNIDNLQICIDNYCKPGLCHVVFEDIKKEK